MKLKNRFIGGSVLSYNNLKGLFYPFLAITIFTSYDYSLAVLTFLNYLLLFNQFLLVIFYFDYSRHGESDDTNNNLE